MRWDGWVGSLDGRPTMWRRVFFKRPCLTVELHKMVSADDPGCFHSHPAHAVRVVLCGGYIDETSDNRHRLFFPGRIGWVRPRTVHRVAGLRNGRASYSLWLRFRKVARIELHGPGWPDDPNTEFSMGAVRVPYVSPPATN